MRFTPSLPAGAKVLSAKVHAAHTTGWSGGTFKINDAAPDSNGFVTLSNPDFSAGYIDVVFKWQASRDGTTTHNSSYPGYNGSSSQSKTYSHTSNSDVSDVYLLIEYQSGSVIYHAENGKLVPYQLFRAEGGKLVPYQLQQAEGGKLVRYG